MSARVSVRTVAGPGPDRPDITAVAVKTATAADELERLAGEADRLRRFRHPGVVGYVDHRQTAGGAELHTLYAGEALTRWQGSVEQAVGLVVALATNLAELHDAGCVHGRIDPGHVLVGPDGRPVLCGLSPPPDGVTPPDDVADAGQLLRDLLDRSTSGTAHRRRRPAWLGPAPTARALERVTDHATDPVPSRRPAARALATALLEALPAARLPDEPPDARGRPGPGGAPVRPPTAAPDDEDGERDERDGPAAPDRGDSSPARWASGGDPAPPPAATGVPGALGSPADVFDRAFADQRDTGEEEVFLDRPWAGGPGPARRAGSRSRRGAGTAPAGRPGPTRARRDRGRAATALAAGAAATVAATLATSGWWGGAPAGRDSAPDGTAAPPDGCPEPGGGGPGTTGAPGPEGPAGAPRARTELADVTGDGCPEAVRITPGGVVEVGDDRWAVGGPGDRVAVGDWDCSGRATPAVLRRATGDVFVFPDWAGRDRPLTVEPAGRVPDGVSIGGREAPDTAGTGEGEPGCGSPVVTLAGGGARSVEVAR